MVCRLGMVKFHQPILGKSSKSVCTQDPSASSELDVFLEKNGIITVEVNEWVERVC